MVRFNISSEQQHVWTAKHPQKNKHSFSTRFASSDNGDPAAWNLPTAQKPKPNRKPRIAVLLNINTYIQVSTCLLIRMQLK